MRMVVVTVIASTIIAQNPEVANANMYRYP